MAVLKDMCQSSFVQRVKRMCDISYRIVYVYVEKWVKSFLPTFVNIIHVNKYVYDVPYSLAGNFYTVRFQRNYGPLQYNFVKAYTTKCKDTITFFTEKTGKGLISADDFDEKILKMDDITDFIQKLLGPELNWHHQPYVVSSLDIDLLLLYITPILDPCEPIIVCLFPTDTVEPLQNYFQRTLYKNT